MEKRLETWSLVVEYCLLVIVVLQILSNCNVNYVLTIRDSSRALKFRSSCRINYQIGHS